MTLLLPPQSKAEQRRERQLAFEQNRQNNSRLTPVDDKRQLQLQSNETNNIFFFFFFFLIFTRLESACISPVNIVPQGGQIFVTSSTRDTETKGSLLTAGLNVMRIIFYSFKSKITHVPLALVVLFYICQ